MIQLAFDFHLDDPIPIEKFARRRRQKVEGCQLIFLFEPEPEALNRPERSKNYRTMSDSELCNLLPAQPALDELLRRYRRSFDRLWADTLQDVLVLFLRYAPRWDHTRGNLGTLVAQLYRRVRIGDYRYRRSRGMSITSHLSTLEVADEVAMKPMRAGAPTAAFSDETRLALDIAGVLPYAEMLSDDPKMARTMEPEILARIREVLSGS